MRVFSAVDVETDGLLDELEEVRDRLDLGFNPVPRDKMHITLQFFEDLDQEEVDEVKEAMEAAETPPFTAQLRGVGAFPSRDYIRVVWAGAESRKLHDLHQEVSRHGIPEDNEHDFQPHITLARVKDVTPGKKRKLQKCLDEFEDHDFGTLQVDSIKLFRSRLTGKGSSYQVLHETEL